MLGHFRKETEMNAIREKWLKLLGRPEEYEFNCNLRLLKTYDFDSYYVELYEQAHGPGTVPRLMMAFPKNATAPSPCVAVPFYFPEAMLGFEPESGEVLERYIGVEMMRHLVERGYAVASADSYHLTYIYSDKPRDAFSRWRDAGTALSNDHPSWSGIGKLVFDTQLVIDALAADERVDASRIAIAGHSLGGKMAFYTGCLDERVKVILASDFGFGWEQSNWNEIWYWGDKLEELKASEIDHASLLGIFAPKPMMLIAGQYDNDDSFEMMKKAPGYEGNEDKLRIINHATGHRPPMEALEAGYDFIDKFLK